MVFVASILFACVLPSVMGLKLNTPADTDAFSALNVTWTTQAGDPTFALLLAGEAGIDIATGVNPAALAESVELGDVPPGTYTLQAVVGDDIDTILSTSGSFTISPAGTAAAAGNNAAAGGAATGAVAATTGGSAGKGGATANAGAAAKAAQAKAAAEAKAKAAAEAKAKAAAEAKAKAAAAAKAKAAAEAKAKAAAQAKAKGKGGRSLVSAKFGRRDLYRD